MPVLPIETQHYETVSGVDPDTRTESSDLVVVVGDIVHLITVCHWPAIDGLRSGDTRFAARVGGGIETRESLHELLMLLGV